MPLDLILGLTAVTTVLTMLFCASVGMLNARYWHRPDPSPQVDPAEVQRLAVELRALATRVGALVKEEPAKPKEHAGVT